MPELLYPVDILAASNPEVLQKTTNAYYSTLIQKGACSQEFFPTSDGGQVQIEDSSVSLLPLYRDDPEHKMLVLVNPRVSAVYLNKSWWSIDDILKTSDSLREGLMQVRSFRERIVLFVLNCLVFGVLERGSEEEGEDEAFFVPHSAEEQAKIFWQHGEAVAFYTIKPKGCLCDGSSSQCYQLPVLDTAFVRQRCRRRGLMMTMLQDFCQCFVVEDALGISCPISAAMYRVCQKFLQSHPEEQDRLWEVEAPGDWSQRESIWLKIQLRRRMSVKREVLEASSKEPNDYDMQRDEEDAACQSGVRQGIEGEKDAPNTGKVSESMIDTKDSGAFPLRLHHQEDMFWASTDPPSCKKPNKRQLKDDYVGDGSFKQVKSGTSFLLQRKEETVSRQEEQHKTD